MPAPGDYESMGSSLLLTHVSSLVWVREKHVGHSPTYLKTCIEAAKIKGMGDPSRVVCLRHYPFHGLASHVSRDYYWAAPSGRSEDHGAPYDVEVSASAFDLPPAILEFLPEGPGPLGVAPTYILRLRCL